MRTGASIGVWKWRNIAPRPRLRTQRLKRLKKDSSRRQISPEGLHVLAQLVGSEEQLRLEAVAGSVPDSLRCGLAVRIAIGALMASSWLSRPPMFNRQPRRLYDLAARARPGWPYTRAEPAQARRAFAGVDFGVSVESHYQKRHRTQCVTRSLRR